MKEKTNSVLRLWFPGRNSEKNRIRKELADAAAEDCNRLLEYAEHQSIDPATAQDMVETLVEDLAAKQQEVPPSKRIRKPRPYLFTAFVRAVNVLRDKEERVKRVAVAELERLGAVEDWPRRQDQKILVNEIVSVMDLQTRRTYWRRAEGHPWKEIARRQGVSVDAAMAAYARGLQRVRERIEQGRGNAKQ